MSLRVPSQKFGLRELCLGGLILRRRGVDVKEIRSSGRVDYFLAVERRAKRCATEEFACQSCACLQKGARYTGWRGRRPAQKIPRQVARNSDR